MRILAYFVLSAAMFGAAWWFRNLRRNVQDVLDFLVIKKYMEPLTRKEKVGQWVGRTMAVLFFFGTVGYFVLSMFFLGAGVRELWR